MAETEPRRVSVQDVRSKLQAPNPPFLVCVYPKAKYKDVNLEGSIGVEEFESKLPSLPKGAEIFFY